MQKEIFIHESLVPMYDLGDIDTDFSGILSCGYSDNDIKTYMTDYYYDKAQVKKQSYDNISYYKWIFQNALSKVKTSSIKSVLELGAGFGCGTYAIADLLPEAKIIASELSASMLMKHKQIGQERFPEYESRLTRCQINADQSVFKSSCFDMVYGTAILHHVLDPLQVIREAGRVLKPNGIAVFAEPFEAGYSLLLIAYEMLLLQNENVPFLTKKQQNYLLSSIDAWTSNRVDSTQTRVGRDDKWLFSHTFFDDVAKASGFNLIIKAPIASAMSNPLYHLYKEHTKGNGIELPQIAETIIHRIEKSFSNQQWQSMPCDGVFILQKSEHEPSPNYYERELAHFSYFSKLISNLSDEYERKYKALKQGSLSFVEPEHKSSVFMRVVRPLFRGSRRIAEILRIKEALKGTRLYRRLFLKGIIDELQ